MKAEVTVGSKRYALRLEAAHDISIPVRFSGERLSVFGAPPPQRQALEAGGFVGDVARGGSCNCDTLSFTPHTSGTHTECIGHIANEPLAVCDLLKDSLIPATLISLRPAFSPPESYDPPLRETDPVITRAALETALAKAQEGFLRALIIRTLPNDAAKPSRAYGEYIPPFFSIEAMEYIVQRGVQHLLVDAPSIDRLADEGKLTNHHIFWQVPRGRPAAGAHASPRTVTELVFVPDNIDDGYYILNLQVAPLCVDAAPSRPLLYEITPL